MIEADLLTTATFATDAARMALQAAPPTDVAAQAPGFVQNILAEVGSAAGDAAGGIGETISSMIPSGSEVSDGAGEAASGAAENVPGR
jgi:hypothetical protein